MGATRSGIALFVLAVACGPLYTAPGYSAVSNVISELAAQYTPHRAWMAAAFVVLGAAVIVEGWRRFRPAHLPFMAFGGFFAAAGLFGHKPITPGVAYVEWMDGLHSLLATLSGVALTVGFVWQAFIAATARQRWLAWLLAAVCVGMPLLMLALPAWQGLVQRAMYLALFAWLWAHYPRAGSA